MIVDTSTLDLESGERSPRWGPTSTRRSSGPTRWRWPVRRARPAPRTAVELSMNHEALRQWIKTGRRPSGPRRTRSQRKTRRSRPCASRSASYRRQATSCAGGQASCWRDEDEGLLDDVAEPSQALDVRGAPLREITGRIRRLRLRPGQLSRPGAQRPVLVPALDYAAPYGTRTRGAVRRVSGSLRNAVQGVAQHARPPGPACGCALPTGAGCVPGTA